MPSPDKIPLSFNRDRAVRQLDARLEELLEKLRKNRPSEDPWMLRRAYDYYQQNRRQIETRTNVSAHKQAAKMGVIRLLKWVS